MKKFRILCLAILLAFAGVMFSSCKKEEIILAQKIELSEETLELSYGESIDVFVTISPANTTFKQFEIIGEYLNVADIECDFENMKLIITARDFVTADITHAFIGVRTMDTSLKEAHLSIDLVEEHQNVDVPQNLEYDGENLTWTPVEGAKGYTIQINDEEYFWGQNSYPLDLDEYAGQTIDVRVKANGKSSNLDSEFTDYISFEILSRPQGLAYNNQTKIISWNAVEHAESYTVQINNRQFVTSATEFEAEEYMLEAKQYQIKVRANTNAAGDVLNSAFSNSLIITKLAAPKDPSIQNGIVIWNTVIGAVGYDVQYTCKRNGVLSTEVFTTNSTMFYLPTDVDTGTYTLKIRSIGNERTTLTSDYGVERNYTKLAPVQNLRVEYGIIVWDANNDATTYTVYFENVVAEDGNKMTDSVSVSAGANVVSYDISNYPAGEYKIDVVANGLSDKISSEKTGSPITVVKLASPKNFQVNKVLGQSIVKWDLVENASAYRLVFNNFEDSGITIQATQTEITQNLVVGQNTAKIKAIGGSQTNGVWYINSDYSDSIVCTKLTAPTLNMSDATNGNISWTSINSQGFESYTVKINTAGGDFVDEVIVSQNKFSLENLAEGDYVISVRANASENSNYYNSDFSEPKSIHKFGIEVLSVQNGTIYDFEANEDENYRYRYYISNKVSPIGSINSYVETTMPSGIKVSVYAQKFPIKTLIEDVYYVASDNSNVLFIQKLPTITDISMANGILHYGSDYANLFGYEFSLIVNDTETINNSTDISYDFSGYAVGDYTVRVNAVSVQAGDGVTSSEMAPLLINSYEADNVFSFKKLGSPASLKITNCVNDADVSALALLDSLDSYVENASGVIAWEGIEFATEYELNIDNNATIIKTSKLYESLQNSTITAGAHTVRIRAIGNGTNVINGEYASVDGNVVNLSFTKIAAPSTLTVNNGKISWSYANENDNPNKDLSFDTLQIDGSGAAVFFLIDAAGRVYSTVDMSDLDFYSGSIGDIITNISTLINRLKTNECYLPESIVGTATLRVFAVPLNAYISNAFNLTASAYSENKRFVISDYSPSCNFVALETPLDFRVENKVIYWSGLRYNVENSAKPLDSYEITIKTFDETYKFVVKEDPTKTYEINAAQKTLYIDDLSNSENCYWNFNRQNFEAFFGEDKYIPDTYSISIRPIASNSSSFIGDDGKTYYYCTGHPSTSVDIQILSNPGLRVKNGVVVWSAIPGIESYRLYISQTPNITENDEYVELASTKTSFELGSYYPAGTYYFNIVAVGQGDEMFSAEFDPSNEQTFIKLDVIENLVVENGILKYGENSVVKMTGNTTRYIMYIRQSNESEENDKIYINGKDTTYELGDGFVGGKQYRIRVQASGDDIKYLNSDLSDYFKAANGSFPTKLVSPVKAYISNGVIYWTAVPYSTKYKVTISGQETSINTINVYYDISDIPAGTYSIKIKAIGDTNYLNSDATEKTDVIKLADIAELKMIDGYIVWKNASVTNYVANINGVDVNLNQTDAFVLNGYVYFALDGYPVGDYQLYLYNYGGSNAISSTKTATYKFTKLSAVSNLKIEHDEIDEKDYFYFDTIEDATKYYINVTATFTGHDSVSMQIKKLNSADITVGKVEFDDIVDYVDAELSRRGISYSVASYQINVLSVGITYNNMVDNYDAENDKLLVISDPSTTLIVTRPAKTTVTAVYNADGEFTGKFTWEEVANVDYYRVHIQCDGGNEYAVLFGDDSAVELDEDDGYRVYKITGKTFANVVYNGSYSIFVVACQNKDSYESEPSNVVTDTFEIFAAGQDGSNNPYQISTLKQFNAIQYNLAAKYKLAVSELTITEVDVIGTSTDMFVGEFDGNAATITLNISASNTQFVGLFAYVGNGAVVENFNVVADIHSTAQKSGNISIASVACYNYGTIRNVAVSGTISTEYNSNSVIIYNAGIACYNYGTISSALSAASILPLNNAGYVYAGGIAAINYGTIEKSGFTGVAAAQMVGGIAAQSINGTIDQCYYQGSTASISSQNNGSSHNYAGGLVGYMQNGTISSSYANAEVTGSTNGLSANNTAYIGGLVGYVASVGNNEGLINCYAVGYKNGNKSNIQISATGTYAYAGVFVGDNKTDSSSDNGGLICLMANTQSFIGNSKSSFENAQSVTNIKNSQIMIDPDKTVFVADGNYLKLAQARYNIIGA